MTKFLLTALGATLISASAGAELSPEPTRFTFTRDGITYTVTETPKAGYVLIEGTDDRGGIFAFRNYGTRVRGEYNGRTMQFRLPPTNPELAAK